MARGPRQVRTISLETLSRNFARTKVRKQIANLRVLSAEMGMANGKTLFLVARDVQEAAKRGIGQTAPAKTKAGRKAIAAAEFEEIDGGIYHDITAGEGKPRPAGKPPKSWGPRRFLYRDILYYLDALTGTAVIGPYLVPWLNRLHEFGGAVRQSQYRIGEESAKAAGAIYRRTGKIPRDSQGRPIGGAVQWAEKAPGRSKNWTRTGATRTANYPARPFMQGAPGVQKALAKASKWFADTFRPRRAA